MAMAMAMAMAPTVVKPLNGAEEYLRWKESMLLRLHTVGVAHVLSDDPPPPPPPSGIKEEDGDAAAAARRKWARDDAVCRGHILAALSDRVFPDYVGHATARAAWDAMARTYDVDASRVARRMLNDIHLDGADANDGGGAPPLMEEIARAEALNAAMRLPLPDEDLAYMLCGRLPEQVATLAIARTNGGDGDGVTTTMRDVWHVARIVEARRVGREDEEIHGK